jgi:hypothetical protein
VTKLADLVRRRALRALGPLARVLLAPRERRVATTGVIGVALALGLAWCAPLALLALGPLLLGVPHLLADARYLVLRPALHRRRAMLTAGAILAAGLSAGLGVRAGLAAAACAALASRASWHRRALVASVALALLAVAQASPFRADVVFFHAHNLVAIGLWLAWRPRVGRAHFLVLASIVAASLLILCAPFEPREETWTGLSFAELGRTLSFDDRPDQALRWVLFFAFAQSVHYVIWLRLIPDEDRRLPSPRSYAQSARALESDVGPVGLWLALALIVVLGAVALLRLALARDVYLGIAYAHGHVELLAAALFAAEGMPSRRVAT